jgi:hypothetical protein
VLSAQAVEDALGEGIHYIINDDGTLKTESVHFHFKCQPGNASPTTTASATATADTATIASPTTTASPTATASPGTGGALLAMGAGALLVGAGLLARRIY